MNKLKLNHDWLIIAIFVLICALTWAITNAYHSYINKKEVVAHKDLLIPLDPAIDQEIFTTLESRIHLEEEQLTKILSETEDQPLSPTEPITPIPTDNQKIITPAPTPPPEAERTIEIP